MQPKSMQHETECAFFRNVLQLDARSEVDRITAILHDQVFKTLRRHGGVVGVSGGVDSAVVLAIAVRALGADRVVALLLPERESSEDSIRLGRLVCKQVGVTPIVEDVTGPLLGFGAYRRRDEVLQAIVDSLRVQARKKEIALELDLPALPLTLEADRGQVERIMLNLLSNAIKYTPRGGRISARARADVTEVVIEVADTGYGIPDNELSTIFDRYSRAQNLRSMAAGTGLGLAISKALVEAHDGQIAVRSQEQQGSTFTVRLPMAR